MGKNEFMTPKAIANRIKSKGLQKLRWYCQMCQKQCRDENGFKCHKMSESHKRQMMILGENPHRFVEGFSEEFEKTFLEHLARAHPYSRVSAKVVYNEYIADKHHVHMNSTNWLTLTEFVKHLGKTGKCKVDQTEKGWFIVLNRKDGSEEIEAEKRAKRERAEREEEERRAAEIAAQVERAKQAVEEGTSGAAAGSELLRDPDGAPLQFAMPAAGGAAAAAGRKAEPKAGAKPLPPVFTSLAGGKDRHQDSEQRPAKRSKLEELIEADKAAKKAAEERRAANDKASAGGKTAGRSGARDEAPWLLPGIIVKVLSKELPDYYKKKGLVESVKNKFVAVVEMLDSGDVLQVDQAQLETVLPQPGGSVMIVGRERRGSRAKLLGVDTTKFQAQVELSDGQRLWLDYEHVCKVPSS